MTFHKIHTLATNSGRESSFSSMLSPQADLTQLGSGAMKLVAKLLHLRRIFCYWMCVRHLTRSRAVTYLIFFVIKDFFRAFATCFELPSNISTMQTIFLIFGLSVLPCFTLQSECLFLSVFRFRSPFLSIATLRRTNCPCQFYFHK